MPTLTQLRERYAGSPDSELQQVLASADYTDEAKTAAREELERRGLSGAAFRSNAYVESDPEATRSPGRGRAAPSFLRVVALAKLVLALLAAGAVSAFGAFVATGLLLRVALLSLSVAMFATLAFAATRRASVRVCAITAAIAAWAAYCLSIDVVADPTQAVMPSIATLGFIAVLNITEVAKPGRVAKG